MKISRVFVLVNKQNKQVKYKVASDGDKDMKKIKKGRESSRNGMEEERHLNFKQGH